jgi:hypothetical protein
MYCGAIRPADGYTQCTRKPHDDEPFGVHCHQTEGMRESQIIEWTRDGTEYCFGCGAPLDRDGRCTAPIAGDD